MLHTLRDDVVGVFADTVEAEQTRDELRGAGFRPDEIEVTAPQIAVPASVGRPFETQDVPAELWARGVASLAALGGGILGCLLGALVGSGAFLGVPPIISSPALAGILGALIGAAVGALLGALIGWGLSRDADSFYARELQAGRTVILVHSGHRPSEAAAIMRRHGASWVRAPGQRRMIGNA